MKPTNSMVIAVLCLAPSVFGCRSLTAPPDSDTDSDTDAGPDADTDFDTDSDTDPDTGDDTGDDTDEGTDDDCGIPSGITDWGQPCIHSADPGECAAHTFCVYFLDPPEGASETLGLCTPACCNPEELDTEYCTDVAAGVESCSLLGAEDQWCGIGCEDDEDCPPGLVCLTTSAGDLCYPPA